MKQYFALVLLVLIIPISGISQITINEYSASNLESFYDSFGKTEDWVELYNEGSASVDISGWHLSDKLDKPGKWTFTEGTIIEADEFLIVYCSGRDGVFSGDHHSNFKLAQTTGKDGILLSDKDENIIESFDLNITLVEHSNCRKTDGSDEWVVCTNPSFNASNDNTDQFAGYTKAPSMRLEAGYYSGNQTVSIINNEENSVLRYTLDGTNPRNNSPEYTGPITIEKTTVIKAQSFSNDPQILNGKMEFNSYLIDEDFTVAVFSVAADQVIELAHGDGELIPIGSIEYFNLDKEREATSFGSLNRHGQDSWVLPHRSLDWVSRDEMGYSKAVEAPLFSYSKRDEYQKFMFRNSGDDNYPAIDDEAHEGSAHIRDEYVQTLAMEGDMSLDQRAVERVVVFLNGEYWGLYGMRERPVDADYTKEYYDQDKYNTQYLTTWGGTEIQYGGPQAQIDWMTLRDFILLNDMSGDENYGIVKDNINLKSLIDYMIVNLNVVASDWLNYNTGWWRGLNPDGDHKKWGYILWDLDATFDYYINYTEIPNTNPNAEPCSLEEISVEMDNFYNNSYTLDPDSMGGIDPTMCATILNGSSPYPATDSVFILTINQDAFCCNNNWDDACQALYDNILNGTNSGLDPSMCTTILNGSSPYPATDSIFILTINQDGFCCNDGWDDTCQQIYNNFLNGSNDGSDPDEFLAGDIGRHETIFLKLLEENETFKQLYYSRYADMMNTVFSCENMNTTLERMLDVIRPEMPRQIDRWGGSMAEWEENVQQLKDFINERCTLLDDGMIDCYDELDGPHQITLLTQPEGMGEIDFNTLDIESFPWNGEYFGGMENKIKAKVFNDFEDQYEFSHWISKSGNEILPNESTRKARIKLTQPDTLIAVFSEITVSTEELGDSYDFVIYPNPAADYVVLDYKLETSANVNLSLYTIMGEKVISFVNNSGNKASGDYSEKLDFSTAELSSGLYILVAHIDNKQRSFKVNIVR